MPSRPSSSASPSGCSPQDPAGPPRAEAGAPPGVTGRGPSRGLKSSLGREAGRRPRGPAVSRGSGRPAR
ncbi:hypothetical protein [Ornithinimicrobium kibberense]|uniref:hypothetical protein n=1 Tax=Ornithinimicrobium kibberense TaxID=282060 RepID=UPI00361E1514